MNKSIISNCVNHPVKCILSIPGILILVFLSLSIVSTAQNNGKVLDAKSHTPLMGVNLFSIERGYITDTNSEGAFYFGDISKMTANDTLCFSYIGYVTKKISLSELKGLNYVVYLIENDQLLNGVTIISGKLSLQHEIKYKQLASLKEGLYSFGATLIGDKICVVGGDTSFGEDPVLKALNDYGDDLLSHLKPTISWQEFSGNLHIYDIPTNKWVNSNLKFTKRAYHCIQYYKNKIYILGGKSLSKNGSTVYLDDKFEVFDIKKNSILVDQTNPHQAINFASFVYHDNLIVMGGSTRLKSNGVKEYTGKVHACNLKTGYWYELEDMPHAKESKGILIGNTIYLLGGFRGKPLTEMETYNVVNGRWNDEGQLPYEVERPGIAYNENIIYIFNNGKIQTYNIVTKEIKVYLINLALSSGELFYADNMLYILGGSQKDESSVSPSSNLYRIDLKEFKKTETYNTL